MKYWTEGLRLTYLELLLPVFIEVVPFLLAFLFGGLAAGVLCDDQIVPVDERT